MILCIKQLATLQVIMYNNLILILKQLSVKCLTIKKLL